jgi:hypothetical protein
MKSSFSLSLRDIPPKKAACLFLFFAKNTQVGYLLFGSYASYSVESIEHGCNREPGTNICWTVKHDCDFLGTITNGKKKLIVS